MKKFQNFSAEVFDLPIFEEFCYFISGIRYTIEVYESIKRFESRDKLGDTFKLTYSERVRQQYNLWDEKYGNHFAQFYDHLVEGLPHFAIAARGAKVALNLCVALGSSAVQIFDEDILDSDYLSVVAHRVEHIQLLEEMLNDLEKTLENLIKARISREESFDLLTNHFKFLKNISNILNKDRVSHPFFEDRKINGLLGFNGGSKLAYLIKEAIIKPLEFLWRVSLGEAVVYAEAHNLFGKKESRFGPTRLQLTKRIYPVVFKDATSLPLSAAVFSKAEEEGARWYNTYDNLSVNRIPKDVLNRHIFSRLKGEDLRNATLCCHFWATTIHQHRFEQELIKIEYEFGIDKEILLTTSKIFRVRRYLSHLRKCVTRGYNVITRHEMNKIPGGNVYDNYWQNRLQGDAMNLPWLLFPYVRNQQDEFESYLKTVSEEKIIEWLLRSAFVGNVDFVDNMLFKKNMATQLRLPYQFVLNVVYSGKLELLRKLCDPNDPRNYISYPCLDEHLDKFRCDTDDQVMTARFSAGCHECNRFLESSSVSLRWTTQYVNLHLRGCFDYTDPDFEKLSLGEDVNYQYWETAVFRSGDVDYYRSRGNVRHNSKTKKLIRAIISCDINMLKYICDRFFPVDSQNDTFPKMGEDLILLLKYCSVLNQTEMLKYILLRANIVSKKKILIDRSVRSTYCPNVSIMTEALTNAKIDANKLLLQKALEDALYVGAVGISSLLLDLKLENLDYLVVNTDIANTVWAKSLLPILRLLFETRGIKPDKTLLQLKCSDPLITKYFDKIETQESAKSVQNLPFGHCYT